MAVEHFTDATEARKIADNLIPAHHRHLLDVSIRYLLSDKPHKLKGKVRMGKTWKLNALQQHFATDGDVEALAPDYLIVFDELTWSMFDNRQRRALVDHELSHISFVMDDDGEIDLKLVGHDVEEFNDVIGRNGPWAEELQEFVKALQPHLPGFDA